MKLKRLFLIFSFLLFTSLCFGEIDAEWYPFVISEELELNSPVNIGKIVLDAPAGKHGFCKVKDGHFYFEDGTRAKFWGTNLVFNACFPPKEQAEVFANRLAFFGFNAVRLHHMDFTFEPEGIFKDICPDCINPRMKKTGILSKEQLDHLDYLIYQLKLRGIYINMNLLVSRHFTMADGVVDTNQLKMAAKPASLFDSKLIELQKQYARDLLTHYNPYTKLRYCDDPVVALVEITNENSMFDFKNSELSNYYRRELKDKKKEWLRKQDRVKKATKGNFYIYIEKSYFEDMVAFLKNECGIKVPISGIGGYQNREDIQAQQTCDFIDTHSYWDHPNFPNREWDDNDFRIQNQSVLLEKNLGIIERILQRSPIVKNKPFTISEWNHCYPNKYAYETPLLIASKALEYDWDGLFQFDFTDSPAPSAISNSIYNYFNIIANPQQLILSSVGSLIYNRTDDLETTVGNGILKFNSVFIRGTSGFIKDKLITFKNFNIKSDQNGSIILYSLENKPIEDSNKLVLIAISEIKNTNSGWMDGKFNWGKAPTLLKHMNVIISLTLKKYFKVYEIDVQGRRGRKIETTFRNNALTFSTQYSNLSWFEITAED